jgi:phosphoribosylanthranilate isomerase
VNPVQFPRIKICCIASVDEMRLAVRLGASAVGLVSAMPSGPGPIPEGTIAEIARLIPPSVASFLLTSKQRADEIIVQQKRCRTNTIQLCDRIERDELRRLRDALAGIALVQVIHVNGSEAIDDARALAPFVDALLLDSGNPKGKIKELGGTGKVHDWTVSRKIREAVDVPIFLAGGLTSDNVGKAITEVGPFAVDVCSGVRTKGKLDEAKLSRFFDEVDVQRSLMSASTRTPASN